ncbi:type VII secretion protein EccB [Nocardioides sp. YIM 152315]|uniref:type VII secretion protein EccB n=1 Tax=Nocardioides sp. YIM 152315 TaxID=3031760 RepID=UPI0023DB2BA3|nr:type VII secretion protein EccB [Nocardioides sp. YIM 152315]MDF1605246.1 type VII secretion protein EccB [Nocardioides sp. YIM 152315]
MATKKDLVEAYSFSRRRLVTAFVSGAPGGREVEPARPGRSLVGGLALAVLLAAGAAITGVFSPTAPTDWKQQGLIISKDTGAAYVIVDDSDDPELRPVINSTSAKLILGGDAEPMLVEQETIDEQRIGDDIGIFGAPASVPTPGLLIDSGWTACTAAGAGVRVQVAEQPDVLPAPAQGVTVTNGDDLFVVLPRDGVDEPAAGAVGAVLLPVVPQGNQTDNLLSALNLQTTGNAIPVSRDWINLFPVGAPLDWESFGITGYGSTPAYAADDDAGVIGDHRVGDLLAAGDQQLLLTESGPVELTEFEAAAYSNLVAPDDRVIAPVTVDAAPRVPRGDDLLEEAAWPDLLPDEAIDEPCAQLETEPGKTPTVQLRHPGDASGAAGLPAGEKEPVVAAGRGAYVLSGGWTDPEQGAPFFIDAKGRANPLVGDGAADALGYGDHATVVVPDTWVELFDCGVNLSRDAALSPPSERDEPACA